MLSKNKVRLRKRNLWRLRVSRNGNSNKKVVEKKPSENLMEQVWIKFYKDSRKVLYEPGSSVTCDNVSRGEASRLLGKLIEDGGSGEYGIPDKPSWEREYD